MKDRDPSGTSWYPVSMKNLTFFLPVSYSMYISRELEAPAIDLKGSRLYIGGTGAGAASSRQ